MTGPIRFDDLWKSYGRKIAVAGLTFEVRAGEVVALLGRNGAGKTSAIKILMGQLKPTLGRALLYGEDSWKLPPMRRARVGYMTEGNRLDPWSTVEQMMHFTRAFYPNWNAEGVQRLQEHFRLPFKRRVGHLSNGERGQLALVLALGADPDVLVLDDPMLGLDAVVRHEFFETMAAVLTQRDRAVLFTSHILDDVERVADRIIILKEGSMLADANLEDLRSRVRRYHLRLKDDLDIPTALPGLLSRRREGRGWSVVAADAEGLRALELESMEEESLSLEEIFVAMTANESMIRPVPIP